MDKKEFEEKVSEVHERWLNTANTSSELVRNIKRLAIEYAESQAPAKEVIPREWAEYIESFKGRNTYFDYLIYGADYDLGLSFGDGSYQKFMRAILNGYTVEPEQRYYVLAPKEWWVDSDEPMMFIKRFELPGVIVTRDPDERTAYFEFTMDEIKEYKLDNFEREEVKEDE